MFDEFEEGGRRSQVERIRKLSRGGLDGRGAYLPGMWAARMAAGLTQRELAGVVETSQSAIHELETQSRAAYPATIRKVSEALDVEPVDLLCHEDLTKNHKQKEL